MVRQSLAVIELRRVVLANTPRDAKTKFVDPSAAAAAVGDAVESQTLNSVLPTSSTVDINRIAGLNDEVTGGRRGECRPGSMSPKCSIL